MGERVTFTGKSCLCQQCIKNNNEKAAAAAAAAAAASATSPSKKSGKKAATTTSSSSTGKKKPVAVAPLDDICAGCGEELRDGQALMALDKQYHVWCFKCRACDALLHGEYMGKDGHPYCERDYQLQFGVKCTYCRRFISGKVLQAGESNHFHPTCARCTKCGDPFGDGEEMFLQGAAIWHPRCGPGPDDSLGGLILNGFESSNNTYQSPPSTLGRGQGQHDHVDMSSMASAPYYGSRASSPGASLRRGEPYYDSGRFSRSTMHVPGWASHYAGGGGGGGGGHGLYTSNSTYSLRRPIEPGDRLDSLANINHFHLPAWRRPSVASHHHHHHYGAGGATTPGAIMSPTRPSMENLGVAGAGAGHYRPISCPPKPGYTQTAGGRAGTPGFGAGGAGGVGSAISPGPGMHFNDFVGGGGGSGGGGGRLDDAISQQSFR